MSANHQQLSQDFIAFCIEQEVLRFGEFTTKAGRLSPYFFNAGLFNDGDSLLKLGEFYANSIEKSGIAFARRGRNIPYAYNRKEAKDHGEGGTVVGAPLQGNVLIIDDVISAGTSIRESVELIKVNGANPCGVSIALDRQEKGLGELSAVQEVEKNNKIPVIPVAKLTNLLECIENDDKLVSNLPKIKQYQQSYCIGI